MIELTYNGFHDWLRSKKPGEYAGVAHSECGCPLAVYMNTQRKSEDERYSIGREILSFYRSGHRQHTIEIPLPSWAISFISHVDTGDDERELHAGEALQILDQCKPIA